MVWGEIAFVGDSVFRVGSTCRAVVLWWAGLTLGWLVASSQLWVLILMLRELDLRSSLKYFFVFFQSHSRNLAKSTCLGKHRALRYAFLEYFASWIGNVPSVAAKHQSLQLWQNRRASATCTSATASLLGIHVPSFYSSFWRSDHSLGLTSLLLSYTLVVFDDPVLQDSEHRLHLVFPAAQAARSSRLQEVWSLKSLIIHFCGMKMNPEDTDTITQIVRVDALQLNVNASQDKLWYSNSAKHHECLFNVYVFNSWPRPGRCSDLLVLRQARALAAPVEVANVCSPRWSTPAALPWTILGSETDSGCYRQCLSFSYSCDMLSRYCLIDHQTLSLRWLAIQSQIISRSFAQAEDFSRWQ